MKTSMELIKAELTEEEQKELNEALMIATMKGAFSEDDSREKNTINGKSTKEVIDLANEYIDKENAASN